MELVPKCKNANNPPNLETLVSRSENQNRGTRTEVPEAVEPQKTRLVLPLDGD